MKRKLLTTLSAATLIVGLGAAPAHASNPGGNWEIGRQYGDVERQTLYQHWDGGGYYMRVYGSSGCSVTDADWETRVSWLGTGWNDEVSAFRGRSGCDVHVYTDANFGGPNGWLRRDQGQIRYVGDGWNDVISSYYVS